MSTPQVSKCSLAALGREVLVEAAQCVYWHNAKVRPAKNPAMPLSTAIRILRTARDLGLTKGAESIYRAEYVLANIGDGT